MITSVHALFYTTDAEAARGFLRDKLRLPHYDAMPGWPLFRAPGEIACHPAGAPSHSISFSCDDIESTVRELTERGVRFVAPIEEQDWGRHTFFELPGGGPVQLYQPKYERPQAAVGYVRLRVTPGARETAIAGWKDGVLRVKVREPAEKGRANDAVARLLAKSLAVPPTAVALKRGATSREKLFEVDGLDDAEIRRRLAAPML